MSFRKVGFGAFFRKIFAKLEFSKTIKTGFYSRILWQKSPLFSSPQFFLFVATKQPTDPSSPFEISFSYPLKREKKC
jgi:hypothetical protein